MVLKTPGCHKVRRVTAMKGGNKEIRRLCQLGQDYRLLAGQAALTRRDQSKRRMSKLTSLDAPAREEKTHPFALDTIVTGRRSRVFHCFHHLQPIKSGDTSNSGTAVQTGVKSDELGHIKLSKPLSRVAEPSLEDRSLTSKRTQHDSGLIRSVGARETSASFIIYCRTNHVDMLRHHLLEDSTEVNTGRMCHNCFFALRFAGKHWLLIDDLLELGFLLILAERVGNWLNQKMVRINTTFQQKGAMRHFFLTFPGKNPNDKANLTMARTAGEYIGLDISPTLGQCLSFSPPGVIAGPVECRGVELWWFTRERSRNCMRATVSGTEKVE
ncbi:unnamed protein product [Protopolystoma xenopodis]|uniref:Uncharacterized protein n=1 Tax=Protopolystoma xenopodis TaxID=117903 RepID=A0A448WJN4_9PLAT|nr:unnamed protein product [Protopolystoma xenopodis]